MLIGTMKTSIGVACAQSRTMLGPASCSRGFLLEIPSTFPRKNQRFSTASFANMLCHPSRGIGSGRESDRNIQWVGAVSGDFNEGPSSKRDYQMKQTLNDENGPKLLILPANNAESVFETILETMTDQRSGRESDRNIQWVGAVSGDFNEGPSSKRDYQMKQTLNDENGPKLLILPANNAESVFETILETMTDQRTSKSTDSLTVSGLPYSNIGQVKDVADVARFLIHNLLPVLHQQVAMLHESEMQKEMTLNIGSTDLVQQPETANRDHGGMQGTGSPCEDDESAKETDAARRSMESPNRKDDVDRMLTGNWHDGDNLKVDKDIEMANIFKHDDEKFMKEALVEAKKAAIIGEVPVGAVIVLKGKIIARAYNRVESERNPTAHAEMLCIRSAAKHMEDWRLKDTIMYVTLEPCAMCAGAILQSRVKEVVWGARNTLLGADGSWVSLFPELVVEDVNRGETCTRPCVHPFHNALEVRRGVLADDCSTLMRAFFRARREVKAPHWKKRPLWLPLPAWVLFKRLLHFLFR